MPSTEIEITNSTTINVANAGGIQGECKKIEGNLKDKKASSEPPSSIYPYPYGSWPY
uniref:Uncharacterized protein n=2 Tax=Meloidogyne TaxID=189290 RepID=A0A6V7U2T7_MELEN|nr:unnamed protein product [Meloidogyne enterolobii]